MAEESVLVLCTAPDAETGARLARGIVQERLAACANLIPGLRSFYTWEGEVQDDAEVQLLLKTRRSRLGQIERWLNENHPYDVPEIIALPITGGSNAYLDWLQKETN